MVEQQDRFILAVWSKDVRLIDIKDSSGETWLLHVDCTTSLYIFTCDHEGVAVYIWGCPHHIDVEARLGTGNGRSFVGE